MTKYKRFCRIKNYNFDGNTIHGELMLGHSPTVSYYLLEDGDCYRPEKLNENFDVEFFDDDPQTSI